MRHLQRREKLDESCLIDPPREAFIEPRKDLYHAINLLPGEVIRLQGEETRGG